MNSTTIEALPPVGTPGSLGNRKGKLGELFVPVTGRTLPTAVALKAWFNEHVVNGSVNIAGYYSLGDGPISLDFSGGTVSGGKGPAGPPDFANVKTTKDGKAGELYPATAWVPNPATPAADGIQPEAAIFAKKMTDKNPNNYGSGAGANAASRNPAVSSAAMKTTLGAAMIMGKSPASVTKP